jgi:hypothetical protein
MAATARKPATGLENPEIWLEYGAYPEGQKRWRECLDDLARLDEPGPVKIQRESLRSRADPCVAKPGGENTKGIPAEPRGPLRGKAAPGRAEHRFRL